MMALGRRSHSYQVEILMIPLCLQIWEVKIESWSETDCPTLGVRSCSNIEFTTNALHQQNRHVVGAFQLMYEYDWMQQNKIVAPRRICELPCPFDM